jgi:hypothetical protein
MQALRCDSSSMVSLRVPVYLHRQLLREGGGCPVNRTTAVLLAMTESATNPEIHLGDSTARSL